MRRLSKIVAVAAVGALALTGCGSNSGGDGGTKASNDICKTAKGDGPKIGVAYDVGGRGDQSFNDSAYAGLTKVVEELDGTCVEAEAGTDENDTTREERLRTLADQGYNPIVAVGFIYSPAAAKVAKEFPDTDIAVIDGFSACIQDESCAPKDPMPNLTDLTFAENEGSFLVGVAAGLKTKSDTVGFVGGTHGFLIKKFEAGYTAGVKAANPQAKVLVTYLTEDENDGKTGFENPTGGKTAAEGQLDKGADIIYHAAGKSGLGVFQAVTAAGEGKWAIGVDSDQWKTASADQKKHILTSMLKRIDTAVYDFVKASANDDVTVPAVVYDLKKDGVGYSKSGGYVDDIADQIDEYAAKIKSGEIKVPLQPAS
ncbi:MAG TPA: BMP family ABC transporter substrate-binding protein [Marmoricola sp.]|nr:BMP family ABC transporter substrate-binding protein [Marmoricola sp.]